MYRTGHGKLVANGYAMADNTRLFRELSGLRYYYKSPAA